MTEENLWARGRHRRHAELYDAEYAKQLERIARIRSEVSANLPAEDLWAGFEEDESPAAPSAPPPPPPLRRRRALGRRADGPAAGPGDAADRDARAARRRPSVARSRNRAPVAAAAEPDERPAPDHPVVVSLKRREPHPLLVAVDHPESRSTKPAEHPEFRSHAATGRAEERRSAERPWLRPPVPPARRSLAAAPRRGDAAPGRDTAKPRRRPAGIRTRWLVVAGALAAVVGFGAAMFAARPAAAPAATVFQVPSQPTGLVALDGRVWVAGPMSGAVWVLDGESGQAVAPPLCDGWHACTARAGLARRLDRRHRAGRRSSASRAPARARRSRSGPDPTSPTSRSPAAPSGPPARPTGRSACSTRTGGGACCASARGRSRWTPTATTWWRPTRPVR